MKRLILGIGLLGVIVAVAYIKSSRQESLRQQTYESGFQSGRKQVAARDSQIDSLERAMDSQALRYRDSVAAIAGEYEKKLEAVESAPPKVVVKTVYQKDTTSLATLKEREIVRFYREQVRKLPADLTGEERKVAVGTVRDETARKYGITEFRLDSIAARAGFKP